MLLVHTCDRYWVWQGKRIRYQRSGEEGTPVVLVHGFGGNWLAELQTALAILQQQRSMPHPSPPATAAHQAEPEFACYRVPCAVNLLL